ncbi:hypothetical protein GE061_019512 [Apolygus lucorum]|uniref:Novel acetylcholine receptor chaperone n=1 Tax=Apolygus lucorum TaxID=248454 RepID=A0A6A4JH94_APOLU|nr:hypothetical protein GE061_019512 [Apolygus lucorum]
MDGWEVGDAEIATTSADCEEEPNNEQDLYNDLPDFRYDETIDKLNATIAKLEAENNELHSMLTEMRQEKEVLETKCSALSTNITSLLKTAKLEVQRKDRTINDLRQQLNEASSRRYAVKRQFDYADKNQNSDSKYSRCDSRTREPASKKPRYNESDRIAKDVGSKSEGTNHGNETILKPPPKITQACQKENVPLTPVQGNTPSGKMNAISKVPAPIVPPINCPTLFSARMYQRLNNQSANQTITLPSVPLIPISDEEPRNRVPVEKRNLNEEPRCAIPNEKIVPKTLDDNVKLPCSTSLSQKSTPSPVVSGIPNSMSASNDSSIKISELHLRSVSDLKKVVCESDKITESAKSFADKIKVGNNESDRVKRVLPPAKVSSVRATKLQDSNAKNKKLALSKSGEQLETGSTQSTGPPPNVKAKSLRKVFVPISRAWNCSKACVPQGDTPMSKCQQSESAAEGDMGSEVTRVTSELTVKINNEIMDDGVNQAIDLFGSPAKWADDCSSDSAKVDGVISRKKFDSSLFGSPYKNGDSCSSEPVNFVIPPGAYEDSCCTNQPPAKVSPRPNKTPPPVLPVLPDVTSNPVLSKNKYSDSTSGSNDLNDKKSGDDSFPHPAIKSAKKNKSVFSPQKDSKTSASLPIVAFDDRSSTGICFPFKHATKYEDSVLGQFDDTAQFVSALAKVDSKISPLSTPIKNLDVIDESPISQAKAIDTLSVNNPTSFKEVFQSKTIKDIPMVAPSDTSLIIGKCSPKPTSESKDAGPMASSSLGSVDPDKSQEKTEILSHVVQKGEESNATTKGFDSSSSLSTSKFIHRSNFSSSFVFTVSSESQSFHDKPVNVLQPRKTPRASVNKRSPVASTSSCNDVNPNPRIAIPDAFITKQEERVKLWEKNRLYENTLKPCTTPRTPSPTKGQVVNGTSGETVKASSPLAQSKIRSPGKNKVKPLLCNGLGTSSIESKSQEKTGVINRLQPKRSPRHPITSPKNNDRVLKSVATISKPKDSTTIDTPQNTLGNDSSCTVVDTTTKALNMIQSVMGTVVPMPVTEPVSAKSNVRDNTIDVPITEVAPNLMEQHLIGLKKKGDEPLKSETASEKAKEISTLETKTQVSVDCHLRTHDTTNKALNMIHSVMNKISPEGTTSNNTCATVNISSPVDSVHKKTELAIKNEKIPGDLNSFAKKRLVEVACSQRSAEYVKVISQVKKKPTLNFTSKSTDTKICRPPILISAPIIKKAVVNSRDSDFKRSSALKKFGVKAGNKSINSTSKSPTISEGVVEKGHTSSDLSSRRVLIRRKSAPILNVSSQSIEKRVANKKLSRSTSSSSLKNDQVQIRQIANELRAKWIVHPIDLDPPKNIYACITSSFSNNDPRALPRPEEPRIPLPISSSKEQEDLGQDNQSKKATRKLNHRQPNVFSPDVSVISRVCSIAERSLLSVTRPIVTSTPLPLKSCRPPIPNNADGESKSLSTGSVIPKTPNKHPILRRSGRTAVARSTIPLCSPVKQERKGRGKKRPATTQPELESPEDNCRAPKRILGNKKPPKNSFKSDVSLESPPISVVEKASTSRVAGADPPLVCACDSLPSSSLWAVATTSSARKVPFHISAGMGSVVLKSLSVLLGLFFIFIGTMKLTSFISKDLHKDLRKEYVKYAKVFPLSQALDIKIPAKWYRRVIGGLELICGLAMALVPIDAVKQGANITLLLLMIMAVYSHYMVNDKFERTAPALVFFFMLTGRMVIEWQLKRRQEDVTSNGDAKQKKQD